MPSPFPGVEQTNHERAWVAKVETTLAGAPLLSWWHQMVAYAQGMRTARVQMDAFDHEDHQTRADQLISTFIAPPGGVSSHMAAIVLANVFQHLPRDWVSNKQGATWLTAMWAMYVAAHEDGVSRSRAPAAGELAQLRRTAIALLVMCDDEKGALNRIFSSFKRLAPLGADAVNMSLAARGLGLVTYEGFITYNIWAHLSWCLGRVAAYAARRLSQQSEVISFGHAAAFLEQLRALSAQFPWIEGVCGQIVGRIDQEQMIHLGRDDVSPVRLVDIHGSEVVPDAPKTFIRNVCALLRAREFTHVDYNCEMHVRARFVSLATETPRCGESMIRPFGYTTPPLWDRGCDASLCGIGKDVFRGPLLRMFDAHDRARLAGVCRVFGGISAGVNARVSGVVGRRGVGRRTTVMFFNPVGMRSTMRLQSQEHIEECLERNRRSLSGQISFIPVRGAPAMVRSQFSDPSAVARLRQDSDRAAGDQKRQRLKK